MYTIVPTSTLDSFLNFEVADSWRIAPASIVLDEDSVPCAIVCDMADGSIEDYEDLLASLAAQSEIKSAWFPERKMCVIFARLVDSVKLQDVLDTMYN